jgi:biopolymer transport protein ExbD
MTLRFACPHCQKRLKVADEHAGRHVNCPRCGKSLVVPDHENTRTPPPLRPSEMLAAAGPASRGSGGALGNLGADDDEAPPVTFRAAVATDEELDLTPMVDVTFQLLIFFMLTMAAGLSKSIEVPVRRAVRFPSSKKTTTTSWSKSTKTTPFGSTVARPLEWRSSPA